MFPPSLSVDHLFAAMQRRGFCSRGRPFVKLGFIIVLIGILLGGNVSYGGVEPRVEAEEEVYTYEPANNGAGPLWCHGSTCLVRVGEDMFASGLETLRDAKPLNNCRWTLFTRGTNGWKRIPVQDE